MSNSTDTNQASEDELNRILAEAIEDNVRAGMRYGAKQERENIPFFPFSIDEPVLRLKQSIHAYIRTEKLKLLDNLERKSTHYTPDGLVADGLDPWAVSVSTINAERNKLEAEL